MRDIPNPLGGVPSPFGSRRQFTSAALRAINRIFPGLLSGETHHCKEPIFPDWHDWLGVQSGHLHLCSEPLPDSPPTSGPFAEHLCEEPLP